METPHLHLLIEQHLYRSQPNYEEWKHKINSLRTILSNRSQPNYEEWKQNKTKMKILSFLMFPA